MVKCCTSYFVSNSEKHSLLPSCLWWQRCVREAFVPAFSGVSLEVLKGKSDRRFHGEILLYRKLTWQSSLKVWHRIAGCKKNTTPIRDLVYLGTILTIYEKQNGVLLFLSVQRHPRMRRRNQCSSGKFCWYCFVFVFFFFSLAYCSITTVTEMRGIILC